MCIIIDNSAGRTLPKSVIEQSVRINSHGFGIRYQDTGELIKTMDMEVARSHLRSTRPFVAHCRLATAGKKSIKNVHPFQLKDGGLLFHNGTIWSLKDTSINDSRQVARMLDFVTPGNRVQFLEMLDSRFLLVNANGEVERAGDWIESDGVYYSKENVLRAPATKTKKSFHGQWYGQKWLPSDDSPASSGLGELSVVDPYADAVESDAMVAVYGTLKYGYGNAGLLKDSSFIGDGRTVDRMRMVVNGLPYLIDGTEGATDGHRVEVEVYAVDEATLADLDALEGHPQFYRRATRSIELDGGEIVECEVYAVDESYDTDHGPYVACYGRSASDPIGMLDTDYDLGSDDSGASMAESGPIGMLDTDYDLGSDDSESSTWDYRSDAEEWRMGDDGFYHATGGR